MASRYSVLVDKRMRLIVATEVIKQDQVISIFYLLNFSIPSASANIYRLRTVYLDNI